MAIAAGLELADGDPSVLAAFADSDEVSGWALQGVTAAVGAGALANEDLLPREGGRALLRPRRAAGRASLASFVFYLFRTTDRDS